MLWYVWITTHRHTQTQTQTQTHRHTHTHTHTHTLYVCMCVYVSVHTHTHGVCTHTHTAEPLPITVVIFPAPLEHLMTRTEDGRYFCRWTAEYASNVRIEIKVEKEATSLHISGKIGKMNK